ncbi:MAG: hypothetical protein CM15mP120_15760 [Pseudomonadota bacterium]|nr:MAG: hypothetical protein CM15mP120_15760 [Pseudomonadota bacterium]
MALSVSGRNDHPGGDQELKSVLPKDFPVLAVGGIDTANIPAYWQAGANGFGLGGLCTRRASLSTPCLPTPSSLLQQCGT